MYSIARGLYLLSDLFRRFEIYTSEYPLEPHFAHQKVLLYWCEEELSFFLSYLSCFDVMEHKGEQWPTGDDNKTSLLVDLVWMIASEKVASVAVDNLPRCLTKRSICAVKIYDLMRRQISPCVEFSKLTSIRILLSDKILEVPVKSAFTAVWSNTMYIGVWMLLTEPSWISWKSERVAFSHLFWVRRPSLFSSCFLKTY